jgi:hypothetical protein
VPAGRRAGRSEEDQLVAFVSGQVLFTSGLDMQCRPVVSQVTFVRYLSKTEQDEKGHGRDCIIETSTGIKMFATTSALCLNPDDVRHDQ